uniref:sulfotransferase 2B1-like n=1 Tax=Myxine glutinosa TaxID=7769 RepID=UPI00359008DE
MSLLDKLNLNVGDNLPSLSPFRGIYLIPGLYNEETLKDLEHFDVLDDDLFIITYPKSGTNWMQVVMRLVYADGDHKFLEDVVSWEATPWLDIDKDKVEQLPRPRIITSHLPHRLMPRGLQEGSAKVIYVARNPKDVIVSFYHFQKNSRFLENPNDFQSFLQMFIDGKVLMGSWFEHIQGWMDCKHPHLLYVTYEDMVKDLRAVVRRICTFLGKTLTEVQIESVVKHSSFTAMKKNPMTNYSKAEKLFEEATKFFRKGKVGDWKNHFTVAQSEWFDAVYQERMAGLGLDFTWDLPAEKPSS